jgi:hypothetical protein
MYLKKIALCVFLLCLFAAMARGQDQKAQDEIVEYGGADELKGIEKVFVDTKADMAVRDRIIKEIRKSLRPSKRGLKFVSKPEESDIHLRFHYETETVSDGSSRGSSGRTVIGGTVASGPYPGVTIVKIPYGTVVKVLSEDRVRVLMSYNVDQRLLGIFVSWGGRKAEVEFAREFTKAVVGK